MKHELTAGGAEPRELGAACRRARGTGARKAAEIWKAVSGKVSRAMEKVMKAVFLVCGVLAIAFVLFVTVYLIIAGLPAIRKIGLVNFLFGKVWASTASDPRFGILPFILTSVYGTFGAILIGVPVGLLTAVFLAKMAPKGLAAVVRPAVDLLAGIPSVVYGLVGISVSETALLAVPKEYEEASLALGATKTETVFKVSLPAASSGVATAIVLGIGRAIGEAMAVMMVAGNVANMPGIFKSVRFLTTAVASEMSYSGGLQRQALFSIALVLFGFIMVINLILNTLMKKARK